MMRIKLDDNSLAGEIPSEILQLTSLKVLSMVRDKLDRTIPSTIGAMRGLESFLLGQNERTGTIPVSLRNLTKLKVLDVSPEPPHGDDPD